MSLTATFEYEKHSTVDANTLSISGAFTSEILNLTIDIGTPNRGRLITSSVGNAHGVFTKELGLLEIIGTKTQINSVLATMKYQGDQTGYFLSVPGSVTVKSGGSTVESGTVTFEPQAPPYYAPVEWETTFVGTEVEGGFEMFKSQAYANTVITTALTGVNDTATVMLNCTVEAVDTTTFAAVGNTNTYGSILVPEAGREAGVWQNGKFSLYASRAAVNTFLKSGVRFKPNNVHEALFKVTVSDERPSTPAVVYLYYYLKPLLKNVATSVTMTEDTTTPTLVGPNISVQIPKYHASGPYTIVVQVPTASATVSTAATSYGTVTPTFDGSFSTVTLTGSNATDLEAAVRGVRVLPKANVDTSFNISISIYDAMSGQTASYSTTGTVTAVNDPPTLANVANARTWITGQPSPVALTPPLIVTDVDTNEVITATLTLAQPGATTEAIGSLGSTSYGSNWSWAYPKLTTVGNVATVNEVLNGLTFLTNRDAMDNTVASPEIFNLNAGWEGNLELTVQIKDKANATITNSVLISPIVPATSANTSATVTNWNDYNYVCSLSDSLNTSLTYTAQFTYKDSANTNVMFMRSDSGVITQSFSEATVGGEHVGTLTLVGSHTNMKSALASGVKLLSRNTAANTLRTFTVDATISAPGGFSYQLDTLPGTINIDNNSGAGLVFTNTAAAKTYLKGNTNTTSFGNTITFTDQMTLGDLYVTHITLYNTDNTPVNAGTVSSSSGTLVGVDGPWQEVSYAPARVSGVGGPTFTTPGTPAGTTFKQWYYVGNSTQTQSMLTGLRFNPVDSAFNSTFKMRITLADRVGQGTYTNNVLTFTCSNP